MKAIVGVEAPGMNRHSLGCAVKSRELATLTTLTVCF